MGARRGSWWRRVAGVLAVAALASGLAGLVSLGSASPAAADGPAPCTTGGPPFPYAGFCATYSGANTWYGSYGPGFPTAQGWGFCADPAASGGGYPVPGDDYQPGGAPAGASTAGLGPLGFAFGEAQAYGWWGGATGQFTADQAAVAGKLLYDSVVWGSPVPAMDPGVLAAYDDLDGYYQQAVGASAPPTLAVGLAGGGTTFVGQGTFDLHLGFPGSGRPLVGQGVILAVTGGSFDQAGGPTTVGVGTDASGNASVPVVGDGTGPVTVTVTTVTQVGQLGIGFYHQTAGVAGAQELAGFPAPVLLSATQALTALPAGPTTGTVSVVKAGDDPAYVGLGGAVFEVRGDAGTVATLTTGAGGTSPASGPLAPGAYQVVEVTAPEGYQLAPPVAVTVVAGGQAVASFTGAGEDHVLPATLTLEKVDQDNGDPLAGAVFDVRYDSGDTGTYDQDLGTCTTAADGTCSPRGNDGAALLPGRYQVTEVAAPPGYLLDPATATQTLQLVPGQAGTVRFADLALGRLQVAKAGDDAAYQSVAGAVFTVTGPAPSTTAVGQLVVGADGFSPVLGSLVPGTYTLTETTAPPGYGVVAPVAVAVAGGPSVTVVHVLDHVEPAALTLEKVDQSTGAPLAGAVLELAYDPDDSGAYTDVLGRCTTGATGTCQVPGDDGATALLPGAYQVTELDPPPGYALGPSPVQSLTLVPGQVATVRFADPALVAASFAKTATGNVDPAELSLAGAVLEVRAPGATTAVAGCTTGPAGTCTTAPTLVVGRTYCWSEVSAPPGLSVTPGACFTAAVGQAASPLEVADPGDFVAVEARKVDAGAPSVALAGAVLDLYRVGLSAGPGPTAPADAASEPGWRWVDRATTGPDGVADFALQLPGYAYCVVEHQAPDDYTADPEPRCTAVLSGSSAVPAPVTTVVLDDTRGAAVLRAHKFNALAPDTDIGGATYDLYVEGPAPAGVAVPAPPADVMEEPGDSWFARGTSNAQGLLSFVVPAGFAWCLREVTAPPDYLADTGLHCSAVLHAGSDAGPAGQLALPEVPATVMVSAHKFNSLTPDTDIPGATYELLVEGAPPAGGDPPPVPAGGAPPAGDHLWAVGTTDQTGTLSFPVPAGHAWCLHELVVPSGYVLDPSYHCTEVLDTTTRASLATVALPEQPVPATLAFTGGPAAWLAVAGLCLLAAGLALLLGGRRRRGGGPPRPPPPPRGPPPGPGGGGRRRALVGAVATAALLLVPASRAPADPATPVWWSAVPSAWAGGTTAIDLSCASATWCVALGAAVVTPASYVLTWDGTSWHDDGNDDQTLTAVSCPAQGWCMALSHDGLATVDQDGTWSTPVPTDDVDTTAGSFAGSELSCPTTTFCATVDLDGAVAEWSAAGGWTAPVDLVHWATAWPVEPAPTLSCPTASWCQAVIGPFAATWDGQSWSAPQLITTASALDRVSCPTVGWCQAADTGGQVLTLDAGAWGPPQPVDPGGLFTLSCSSPSWCLARGLDGTVATWSSGAWSTAAAPVPGGLALDLTCAPGPSACLVMASLHDPVRSVADLVSLAVRPPSGPVAGLSAPGSATAGAGVAAVTLTPSAEGFVGLAGADGWTATYRWACTPEGAGDCTTAAGPISPPAADASGTFDGPATDGQAPATLPPFTAELPVGQDQVTMTLTDTTSGASTTASAPVDVQAPPAPCSVAIAPAGGGGDAPVGTAFPTPLTAEVRCGGSPDPGAVVHFVLPASGPSGSFPDGTTQATATAGPDGAATSPPVTAGPLPGTWTATATTPGAPDPAAFALVDQAPATVVATTAAPPAPAAAAPAAASPVAPASAVAGPATLAFTGGPGPGSALFGAGLLGAGGLLAWWGRRRRPTGSATGDRLAGTPEPPGAPDALRRSVPR